jgi:flavodoxin
MKVTAIYFSATGNTEKNVKALAEGAASALGGTGVEAVDVTCQTEPALLEFGSDDFVVFGMPVYAGRLPLAVKARLKAFRGNGTSCIVAVSYGNRHYEDALLELADMAEEQGLEILSITDHDHIGAYSDLLDPAIRNRFSGRMITGVEITAILNGQPVEVLAYGFDPKTLAPFLEKVRERKMGVKKRRSP